jgi:hypothetical protein
MDNKARVHHLFEEMAREVLAFIVKSESKYSDNWVPATYIKNQLGLKLSAYPKGNKIDNETGWLFSTIARFLQDKNLVEFQKVNTRSFYKSLKQIK